MMEKKLKHLFYAAFGGAFAAIDKVAAGSKELQAEQYLKKPKKGVEN